jgi:two-component system cell cycle sensor histidine kinase/response regulator CckA
LTAPGRPPSLERADRRPLRRPESGASRRLRRPSLETLLVSPGDGLFLFSPDLDYLYVNAAGAAMTGNTPDQLVGRNFIVESPAVEGTEIVTQMRRAMETGAPQRTGPIQYDDGNAVGDFERLDWPVPDGVLVLVRRPASETGLGAALVEAREEARQREEYRTLAEHSTDLIARFDRDLRHRYVNAAAAAAGALAPHEYIGRTIAEAGVAEPAATAWEDRLRHVLETGEALDVVDTFTVAGETRWFHTRFIPEYGEDGIVVSVLSLARDITERARAEEAVRASAERLRSLFEHTKEGLAHCRMEWADGRPVDWTYLSVNDAFESLTGLRGAVGRRVTELIPGIADTNPEAFEIYGRVAAGGPPEHFESHVPGLAAWFEVTVHSLAPGEFVAAFDVITERKRAEEALRESEERYRGLFHGLTLGVAAGRMVYEDGRPVDWVFESVNEAYGRVTGLEDVTGKLMSEVVPGIHQTDPWLLAFYDRIASTGVPDSYEMEIKPVGRWLSVSAFSPGPGRITAVIDDVTERRRGQQAAAERAARDSLLVEESVDAIFRHDLPRGRFIDVNPATCDLFGYTRDELLGLDLVDLTIVDAPRTELAPPPALARGETATLERSLRRKDGSQATVSIRVRQLPDGSLLANARDLTRERALEAQVEHAQRMEAVGRLAGGIAHDFNNQLMAINGYAALVAEGLPPGDPLRPDIDAIREAGERAAALTRQLLAFSRRQTLQPTVLDVGAVVASLRTILARLLGEDVTLFVRADPEVGSVWADRPQLEQVVVNLVTNARDAMQAGGALAIETTEVEIGADDHRLRPPAVPGRYVRLAVTDTGTGIDAETLEHIFEPFFTTKERGRGTGLGLSTVDGVVAQSGGFVAVESAPGRGSTFDVFLPLTTASLGERAAPSPDEIATAPHGTETVLLVEDEPAVRAVAGRILRELGYDVIEATGPTQALVIASGHPGPIDILLTDVVMPEMNGRELAEKLAERMPGLSVVFMSGYSPESVFRDGYLVEGAAYLQKPFTREDLAARVRAQLDGRNGSSTASP